MHFDCVDGDFADDGGHGGGDDACENHGSEGGDGCDGEGAGGDFLGPHGDGDEGEWDGVGDYHEVGESGGGYADPEW